MSDGPSTEPTPTGGFTTIDAPPRRVAGVSQPYGRNSPRAPTRNRQRRAHSRPSHDQTQPPTLANGGFTTIDTPPRRVAGVSQPYGRNSPHTPTHNRQPRHHSRPSHDQTQPPTHTNRGFYYHRHPTTACRRRVAALWSQFPPRPHPQPPATPPQQAQPRPNTAANPRAHPQPPTTHPQQAQPRPRPCRFRATNLRLPLRTPRGGLPCAARAPGRPGDIGSLSGTRRLGAPLHWCHA